MKTRRLNKIFSYHVPLNQKASSNKSQPRGEINVQYYNAFIPRIITKEANMDLLGK